MDRGPINKKKMQSLCLQALEELGQATYHEIAEWLWYKGHVVVVNGNYSNPRLSELKKAGRVQVVGRQLSEYGVYCSIYELVV